MLSFRRVLAVAVGMVIVAAPSAIAHSTLELSDPGPGETVEGTVTHIELMFSEDFRNISIVLEDPEGNIVDGSIETVNARTARLLVPVLQRGGEYLVRYDVLSQDSDPVASSYAFTFSAPRRAFTRNAALWLAAIGVFLAGGAAIAVWTFRSDTRR